MVLCDGAVVRPGARVDKYRSVVKAAITVSATEQEAAAAKGE